MAKRKSSKKRTKAREAAEELIASGNPGDWAVAWDLASENDIQDLIIQLDMAKALKIAPGDLEVLEASSHWHQNNVFEVSTGSKEWVVAPNEDIAVQIALDRVVDDLTNEPEIFNREFLERHINQDKLSKWVYDARMEDDYVEELANHQIDDFWRLANQFGVDVPEPDEDGEMPEPGPRIIHKVKEAYAEDAAQNPMAFFEDMYDREEAVKHAIEAAGIDIEAAAQDAIDTDGWQHFMSSYDGKSYETPSGLVYWRTN